MLLMSSQLLPFSLIKSHFNRESKKSTLIIFPLKRSRQVNSRASWSKLGFSFFSISARYTSRKSLGLLGSLVALCSKILFLGWLGTSKGRSSTSGWQRGTFSAFETLGWGEHDFSHIDVNYSLDERIERRSPEHATEFTNDPTSGVQSWHKIAENPPNWEKVLQRNLALKKPDIDIIKVRE